MSAPIFFMPSLGPERTLDDHPEAWIIRELFEPLGLDASATAVMYRDEVTRWSAFIKERGMAQPERVARQCEAILSKVRSV